MLEAIFRDLASWAIYVATVGPPFLIPLSLASYYSSVKVSSILRGVFDISNHSDFSQRKTHRGKIRLCGSGETKRHASGAQSAGEIKTNTDGLSFHWEKKVSL